MPTGDVHKRKLKKNIAVFGLVVGVCVLIWAVTMIKISG